MTNMDITNCTTDDEIFMNFNIKIVDFSDPKKHIDDIIELSKFLIFQTSYSFKYFIYFTFRMQSFNKYN